MNSFTLLPAIHSPPAPNRAAEPEPRTGSQAEASFKSLFDKARKGSPDEAEMAVAAQALAAGSPPPQPPQAEQTASQAGQPASEPAGGVSGEPAQPSLADLGQVLTAAYQEVLPTTQSEEQAPVLPAPDLASSAEGASETGTAIEATAVSGGNLDEAALEIFSKNQAEAGVEIPVPAEPTQAAALKPPAQANLHGKMPAEALAEENLAQRNAPEASQSAAGGDQPSTNDLLSSAGQLLAGKLAGESAPLTPANVTEARNQQIFTRMMEQIAIYRHAEQSHVHIKLDAEHLGKIDVRLMASENGMLVFFNPDLPSTSMILEQYQNELRTSLNQAGVQLNGLTIGAGGSQEEPGNGPRGQSKHRGQGAGSNRLAAVPQAGEPGSPAQILTRTAVDYRI